MVKFGLVNLCVWVSSCLVCSIGVVWLVVIIVLVVVVICGIVLNSLLLSVIVLNMVISMMFRYSIGVVIVKMRWKGRLNSLSMLCMFI